MSPVLVLSILVAVLTLALTVGLPYAFKMGANTVKAGVRLGIYQVTKEVPPDVHVGDPTDGDTVGESTKKQLKKHQEESEKEQGDWDNM